MTTILVLGSLIQSTFAATGSQWICTAAEGEEMADAAFFIDSVNNEGEIRIYQGSKAEYEANGLVDGFMLNDEEFAIYYNVTEFNESSSSVYYKGSSEADFMDIPIEQSLTLEIKDLEGNRATADAVIEFPDGESYKFVLNCDEL